ncbi:MAG: DUF885 domain-containing protein [Parvularcula sp.]
MTPTRRTVLLTGAAASTAALLPASALGRSSDDAQGVLDRALKEILTAYPESATGAGVDTGKFRKTRSRLTDRSAEGQAAIAQTVSTTLDALRKIDTDALSPDQSLNVAVVKTVYERAAEGFKFPYGDVALLNSNWSYRNTPYCIAQNVGAFVEIPSFLTASHKIETRRDAEAYLDRMEAYAGQLDGETERSRADADKGVILPDFLMAKTLNQLKTAIATPVEEWSLVTELSSHTEDMRGRLADRAKKIATDVIRPALERQVAELKSQAPKTTSKAGVWALPDGEAYYDWALRAGTTTTMSPDEIHEMGLSELADLHARMDPILRSIGYTEGSVGDRMTALGNDPRYKFADGDEGRAEIMAFIEEKVEEIRGLMPQAFNTLVPGFLEVTRIPPDVEAGAPGAYGGAGTVDGKQPGHFWINLRTPDLHRKFSLADLTYHEAIPGHVWQGEYTFKQPLIRSLLAFNAYSEGWALYAEQIADELGVYDDYPVGRLGYLQSLAFRACRLVVDTGLHAKRWTREEAIEWFVTNNGSNPDEVQSEVDRYCAWPGQACGYKVGHSAINRLRDKAMRELGDKYDFKQFNDAVVLGGNVPMTVLGNVIDGYIARTRG